jgi:Ser/Thr protein kinase RdoA (MazF antagonist)
MTTAKDVYYVAISRARHEARIYTDSVKELPAAIARENVKLAALDIERESQRRRDRPETGTRERHAASVPSAPGRPIREDLAREAVTPGGRER